MSELLFAIGGGYFPMVFVLFCDVLCNHHCYNVRTDMVEILKAKFDRATSVLKAFLALVIQTCYCTHMHKVACYCSLSINIV